MTKYEQRREPRYQGKLPVQFESGKGITKNFSGSSVFFETDRSFSTGQTIEFTLTLEYIDPERPVYLNCQGEIVRTNNSGQKIGVAVSINSFRIKEFKEENL